MSDHEFEKQVQRKLDELKIRPSDAVWQGLNAQLRQPRSFRRRWIMFAASVLLITIVFIAVQPFKNNSQLANRENIRNRDGGTNNAKNSETTDANVPSTNTADANGNAQPKSEGSSNANGSNPLDDELNSSQETTSSSQGTPSNEPLSAQRSETPQSGTPDQAQTSSENNQATDRLTRNAKPAVPNPVTNPKLPNRLRNSGSGTSEVASTSLPAKKANASGADFGNDRRNIAGTNAISKRNKQSDLNRTDDRYSDLLPRNTEHSVQHAVDPYLKFFPALSRLDNEWMPESAKTQQVGNRMSNVPPVNKTKARPMSGSLQWGFSASVGVTRVIEDRKLFEPTAVQDVGNSLNYGNPQNIPTAPIQYTPSTISTGIAYSGGVFVRKAFTSRLSVTAGLNYSQLNTHAQVGRRIDSAAIVNNGPGGYLSVERFYDANPQTEYNSKYHFIELPVSFEVRLTRKQALPLYWNAGLALSRLISTNALHFDGTTGRYYKENGLLQKTQLVLSSGFAVTLLNKTSHPLTVGPSLRYHATTLLTSEVKPGKHLMALSLDVKVPIGKIGL
jgi:cytoskeletal protein RodZ